VEPVHFLTGQGCRRGSQGTYCSPLCQAEPEEKGTAGGEKGSSKNAQRASTGGTDDGDESGRARGGGYSEKEERCGQGSEEQEQGEGESCSRAWGGYGHAQCREQCTGRSGYGCWGGLDF